MLRSLLKPIALGSAKCSLNENILTIAGKHGTINMECPEFIKCTIEDGNIVISPKKALTVKGDRAKAGSFKANLLLNIKGVNDLHEKFVIFTGTGCSVKEASNVLSMRIGKSHIVEKKVPDGLKCNVESSDIRETKLKVVGIDLALVGRFASELTVKNAYKGGIHVWVEGKEIPLKEGKSG